jgi:hypothetical protein
MKNKISMTKMSISMTFKRIFPDLQTFQAWNQQVQISKTFQIFKAPYEPRERRVSDSGGQGAKMNGMTQALS